MLNSTLKRVAVVAALAGTLVTGAAIVPAAAAPAEETIYLAAMKDTWKSQPVKTQKTTCLAYKVAPRQLVSQSLDATIKDPASKRALTKAQWRRVIKAYLTWACSGAGATPR